MAHQLVQNLDTSLVLSNDAKPRLKWTPELHRRFVDAVTQLGGADSYVCRPYEATPKNLMRALGIPGLTLYHLKSHLQKYRLGKSQQPETNPKIEQQDCEENQRRDGNFNGEVGDETQNQINDCFQIAQALQMQMEVQRKLHEQLEVQRHLQLRIEAQGKYLQSVLKKAQETLIGYDSSSIGVELAKAVLSDLVSMVDNGGPSSSLSALSDIGGSSFIETEKNLMGNNGRSLEGSLTSSESSGRKEEKQSEHESGDANKRNGNPVLLPLMDQCSRLEEKGASSNQVRGRKRSGSTIFNGNCAEQASDKRSATRMEKTGDQPRKFGLLETFDLNNQYLTEFDAGPKAIIDLN